MKGNLANVGSLSLFIGRRDRIRIPLWVISISIITLLIPPALLELYRSKQDRMGMAETMDNPAMTAMVGPGDLSNYTIGAMTAHQMLLFTAVVVGLMSILLVGRHTRKDEEEGRIEIIRSLPVGRLSTLNASIFVLTITNVVLALLIGFGLFAMQVESMDLEGSLLYGATLGATGLFFTGVTALFAQVSENARGTVGYAFATLTIAYLVRAIGDVGEGTLSWVSPLGWVTKAEVYSSNNWMPIMLLFGVSIILLAIANYLHAIRDLGEGLFLSRPGRKYASAFLKSPTALYIKLQRTGFIAWGIGMLLLGISYGSVLGDLDSFFEGNEMVEQILLSEGGRSITEQFIPIIIMIASMLATVPPIIAILKLRSEEKMNRIDHLLSRVVSRNRLMGSFLFISVLNGLVMLLLPAVGLWGAGQVIMDEPFSFGSIIGATMAYFPAMLFMIGVAVCIIGFLPRFTSIIWFYLLYSFLVLYLGRLFQLPDWAEKITPFGYIPKLPIENVETIPLVFIAGMAVLLIFIGFLGYRRRDIEG